MVKQINETSLVENIFSDTEKTYSFSKLCAGKICKFDSYV